MTTKIKGAGGKGPSEKLAKAERLEDFFKPNKKNGPATAQATQCARLLELQLGLRC